MQRSLEGYFASCQLVLQAAEWIVVLVSNVEDLNIKPRDLRAFLSPWHSRHPSVGGWQYLASQCPPQHSLTPREYKSYRWFERL